MYLLLALLLVLLAGLIYQAIGSARDLRRYPPPGRLVDAGGVHLHAWTQGDGRPAVVLEAGVASTSLSWGLVQPRLAEHTRAISYDRTGLGWSQPARTPREIPSILDEWIALLDGLGITEPCILVGHSFGGMLALLAAILHPGRVAGLVLVDPLTPEEWNGADPLRSRMLARGVRLSRRGATLAKFGVVRLSLSLVTAGWHGVPKFIARMSSGRAAPVTTRLVGEVRKLPAALHPIIKAHWCRPGSFRGMADYLEALPACSAQAAGLLRPIDQPLMVLSAANAVPSVVERQRSLAALSPRGVHLQVPGSGHWIQLDRPDAVVEAVLSMVEQVRSLNPSTLRG